MFDPQHLKRVIAACILATGMGLGLAATPSQAQSLDTITCTGSTQSTFNPPLTNQLADTTFNSQTTYGTCISTIAGITGGSRSVSAPINSSCLELLDSESLTMTIDWNNGQSSTVQANAIANIAAAVFTVTQTGTVTGGPFAGRSFVQQLTAPSLDITLCTLGLGNVSTINHTVVLEIL